MGVYRQKAPEKVGVFMLYVLTPKSLWFGPMQLCNPPGKHGVQKLQTPVFTDTRRGLPPLPSSHPCRGNMSPGTRDPTPAFAWRLIMPVKAYYFTPGRKRKFSINFNTLFLFRLLSIFIKYFLLTVENSSRRTDQCQVRMKTFSDWKHFLTVFNKNPAGRALSPLSQKESYSTEEAEIALQCHTVIYKKWLPYKLHGSAHGDLFCKVTHRTLVRLRNS
jgi:hypothetical protein